MNELEKIKYHQNLLIHIATNKDPEKTVFFQNVIVFDLSENQAKNIIKVIMQGNLNDLIEYVKKESINYPVESILEDCINQDICVENSKQMKLKFEQ